MKSIKVNELTAEQILWCDKNDINLSVKANEVIFHTYVAQKPSENATHFECMFYVQSNPDGYYMVQKQLYANKRSTDRKFSTLKAALKAMLEAREVCVQSGTLARKVFKTLPTGGPRAADFS